MTRATLVIYHDDGEPTTLDFNVQTEEETATIIIGPNAAHMESKMKPEVIPVAACPVHFASSLDVQGGTNPESWWFKCRTNGETYTYRELQVDV